MSLLDELKRRNVLRVAVAYLAGSWLLIQILETLFPIFGAAETSIRFVVIALAIGFIPVVILSWVFEFTPTGFQLDKDARQSSDHKLRNHKTLDRIIIGILMLALVYFAVDKFIVDPGRDAAREQAVAERTRTEALVSSFGDRSIAVLPFINMSSDPDQEYFSDGITEEVLNLLAQVSDLRVISRSSSFAFKGQKIEIPDIASRLKVAHILEGSVRKSGNRVRITAQLIDGRSDTHIWSSTFDRDLGDIFAIQDEISAKVVEQLKVTLLGNAPTSEKIDSTAYGLFLRARHINHTGQGDKLLAEQLLTESLQLEPDYLPAISELARVYLDHSYDFDFESEEDRRRSVRDLVDRIAQVAPGAREELGWRAWIALSWDSDPQAAARFMERALRRNPRDLDILRSVAWFLSDLGREDEAIAVAKYVAIRDPACISCLINLSVIHRTAGQFDDAEKILQEAIEWAPDRPGIYWALGSVLLMAGKPDEAFDAFTQMKHHSSQLGRILALHDLGRLEEFESEFATFRLANQDNYEGIARIYAWTGDNDQAFEWLEKHADETGPNMLAQLGAGFYDKLKADSRWQAMLVKHGVDQTLYDDVNFDFTLSE